jgi:SOS response regulatory protein OraA/RecX
MSRRPWRPCHSQGLVSDRRYAESLVRNRVERGYGPLKITHELRAKGVDDAVIEEVLEHDEAVWLERLRAFCGASASATRPATTRNGLARLAACRTVVSARNKCGG